MLELPESKTICRQAEDMLRGKTIVKVVSNQSPHKFAWFRGNPEEYAALLCGKTIGQSTAYGGMVEIAVKEMRLIFADGVNLRYFAPNEPLPKKHQLLLEFEDGSSLLGSVQMYGALWVLSPGQEETYNLIARSKPDPLSDDFSEEYFRGLYGEQDGKLSVKAFLATKQRIPGLGNGVLQDILFHARLHPKRKMNTLTSEEFPRLYHAVTQTLLDMTLKGGRDTERDLLGCRGGYRTILSARTKDQPCPVCGREIQREAYLGGNVYYCPNCQPLE